MGKLKQESIGQEPQTVDEWLGCQKGNPDHVGYEHERSELLAESDDVMRQRDLSDVTVASFVLGAVFGAVITSLVI